MTTPATELASASVVDKGINVIACSYKYLFGAAVPYASP
jgi:hypothetical protein